MDVECQICGRMKSRKTSQVYETTEEERAALRRMGDANPSREVAYCRPCFRILSDPERSADLMKGVIEQRLRALGVPNAEHLALKFKDSLLAKVKERGHLPPPR